MTEADAPEGGTHPKPANNAIGAGLTFGMWSYLAILAVAFIYALCVVWPPQPWPLNPDDQARAQRDVAVADATRKEAEAKDAKSRVLAAKDADKEKAEKDAAEKEAAAKAASEKAASFLNPSTPSALATDIAKVCDTPGAAKTMYPPVVCFLGHPSQPSLDVRLILLVLCAGALGSFIHAGTSFVDYIGNRAFVRSWLWWYLLRPFIGAVLALLIYFVIRGGFVTGTGLPAEAASAASFINPFGIAALAGLSGLFSKQATDKLNEVFSTLFRAAPGEGDTKRADKLQSGVSAAKLGALEP
ncbi:MAG TPA: hypothetical protein VMV45_14850, partial [Casimicrobiaceae bacterium]|nr:hypothetical protein [Casimicrobiaceae bacterium]